MKKHLILLLALSICIALSVSCSKEKDKKIEQLRQQVQVETEKKETAQQAAQKIKNTLSLMIGINIASVLIAGIIGIAVGSKARQDAIAQQNAEGRGRWLRRS